MNEWTENPDGSWNPPAPSGISVVGSASAAGPTGSVVMWPAPVAPPGWLLCDGSSLLRATYRDLFNTIGTTYGAVDGTHFNLPNLKGRVPVGFDSTQTEFDALGETGGAKTVTLDTTMIPSHAHGDAHTHGTSAGTSGSSSISHQHGYTHDHASFATAAGGAHPHASDMDIIASGTHGHSGTDGAAGDSGGPSNPDVQGTVKSGGSDHAHTIDIPSHSGTVDPGDASHGHTIPASTTSSQSASTTDTTGGGLAHQNLQPYIVFNFIIKAA